MKIKHLLFAILPVVAFAAACTPEETPIEDIIVKVEPSALPFDGGASDKTVQLTATRDWEATINYDGDAKDWISISPASGKASGSAQTVTVTVKENVGRNRSADIVFNIGLEKATLKVSQTGPAGTADPVYFNNFDKEAATPTYGSKGDSWPMPNESECWKNETGTGASGVFYTVSGNKATIRNNSKSTGSGVNNWFFGKESYFNVNDIALPSTTNYTLSFLGIRNVYGTSAGDGKSIFDHSAFKVYISADTQKWVELQYAFEGGDPDNAWATATSTFTVPAGTTKLSIYIPTPSETSVYRLDDLKLDVADAAGTAIDFSKGIDITVGGTDGGGTVDPGTVTQITVAEFVSKADKNTTYKLVGKVSAYKYDKYMTFDLTDASGTVYVYKVNNQTDYKDIIKDGGTVTLTGKYDIYNNKAEVVDANIVDFTAPQTKTVETEKVSEAIAANDSDTVILKNALVVATSTASYLVTDGTDYIYVFYKTAPTEKLPVTGDKVNIEATKGVYYNMPQLNEPKTTIVSSNNAITTPAVQDISATLGTFESTSVKYVSYTGKLAISGSYYNVSVPGVTGTMGAFVAPSFDVTAFVGVDNVTYEGYYIYSSSNKDSKFVYLILTKALPAGGKFFNIANKDIKVAADATSAEIAVSGNVKWTASSDNSAFTLDKAAGEGEGKITVTFPANTAYEAKTAKVTVATTEDVATKSYVVTITQGAAQDPNAKFVELTNDEIVAFFASTTLSGYNDIKLTAASGEWTGQVNCSKGLKFLQIRNSLAAHIMTPAFSSEIQKIELTACATTSGSNEQTRNAYVVTVDTNLATASKDEKYSATVDITKALAGPATFKGAPNVESTQTLDVSAAGVKQCKIICYDGALYIKSIKVYLK